METTQPYKNPRGSVWNRWEPHIHVPGTLLNDQYTGATPLEDFLIAIENSDPAIKALGITDYYNLDLYETILAEKNSGRLAAVEFIFPNVELRLNIGTTEGSGINLHLLISPDDPGHVQQASRFLGGLQFKFKGEVYSCTNDDLTRLGKAYDSGIHDTYTAIKTGANQFKVDFNQLVLLFKQSDWAKKNILVAVAGNSKDGTGGLQKDASFTAIREEIQRTSHIIFSSAPKQREYWLGRGTDSIAILQTKYGGPKPCLHGSDAHTQATVGKPALERYSWIKGDVNFESLRQACIEPGDRAFIGNSFPASTGTSSQIIESVNVENADWLTTPYIPINSGLVAIIGARGSGKTALADLIAAGSYAFTPQSSERSFLRRASELLSDEKVTVNWKNASASWNELKGTHFEDIYDSPKVQYLSQQFVEELCSAEGLTDKLVKEIERVVFQAHKREKRFGTESFEELLELRTSDANTAREEHEENLKEISQRIIVEQETQDNIPQLQKQQSEVEKSLATDKATRTGLVGKGHEDRAKNHDTVSKALDEVKLKLDAANRNALALQNLKNDATRAMDNVFGGYLVKLKQLHIETNLNATEWENFRPVFTGNVHKLLDDKINAAKKLVTNLTGLASYSVDPNNKEKSLLTDADLNAFSFNQLTAELERLQSLIGIDKDNSRRYSLLTDKISRDETTLNKIKASITHAKGSDERIKTLMGERRKTYKLIIQAIIDQQKELEYLYEPLMSSLQSDSGTLGKLSFNVRRFVSTEQWASDGESHLDLRKSGPLKGKGALLELARKTLLRPWLLGDADEIEQAMESFRNIQIGQIMQHAPVEKTNKERFHNWAAELADWFYSTSHIKVSYGIQYDKVNIKQLSPGTRGIVLLLLYLSIDKEDDRPLIIDQPEENLDPKSIYDELVTRFRSAKLRRQIFIVTHNANLVVNTDADQVIVARCGDHRPDQLPLITYSSGGLENPEIRKQVCEILEGGEAAFRERAKRLRVILEARNGW